MPVDKLAAASPTTSKSPLLYCETDAPRGGIYGAAECPNTHLIEALGSRKLVDGLFLTRTVLCGGYLSSKSPRLASASLFRTDHRKRPVLSKLVCGPIYVCEENGTRPGIMFLERDRIGLAVMESGVDATKMRPSVGHSGKRLDRDEPTVYRSAPALTSSRVLVPVIPSRP